MKLIRPLFKLINLSADVDHCLLTVVTWSAPQVSCIIPVDEKPSVFLSSLKEYIHLRRVQTTPLLNISLPHLRATSNIASPLADASLTSRGASRWQHMPLISYIKRFMGYQTIARGLDGTSEQDNIKRSASILHYKSSDSNVPTKTSHLNREQSPVIKEETESASDSEKPEGKESSVAAGSGDYLKNQGLEETVSNNASSNQARHGIRQSVSEGHTRHSPSPPLDLGSRSIESGLCICQHA